MSEDTKMVFANLAAAKARVAALSDAQKNLETAHREAKRMIRGGGTSGDLIEDALIVGNLMGNEEVGAVLRRIQERLLHSPGELFLFGHHSWQEYSDTDRTVFERPPETFYIGFVPEGGMKLTRSPLGEDELIIESAWCIKLEPRVFGSSSVYAHPFQDWELHRLVSVPIGGWEKYPPILCIGNDEIGCHYTKDVQMAEFVLALKSGKSGLKCGGSFAPLRADDRSKQIIEALPVPALVLA